MSRSRRTILCLMGPTAAGKTDVAIGLAARLPVDLVSVDSAMVYRGMDIGTAKPDRDTLRDFPHQLVDVRDPDQSYSVAAFVEDARQAIERAFRAERLPVLVGGTMLYFKALLGGLAELPRTDAGVRARLRAESQQHGLAVMHERLRAVDPVAAERIHPNNSQRLLRALEVYESSGLAISDWWARQESTGVAAALDCQVLQVALLPPRTLIHQRIEARFAAMLGAGLVAEVESLVKAFDLTPALPSMRAVGYRQVWEHLRGECSEAQMIERALAATRQLAKRQLTWLRSFDSLQRLDPGEGDSIELILNYLEAVPIVV